MISGQEVPKGYWLVPAQWFKLVQTSQRAYVLQAEKMQLNVNAMVRLPEPITFEPVQARKKAAAATPLEAGLSRFSDRLHSLPQASAPTPSLPQREKTNFLGEPKHNEILVSLADVRL